jgi:hypothetical protein
MKRIYVGSPRQYLLHHQIAWWLLKRISVGLPSTCVYPFHLLVSQLLLVAGLRRRGAGRNRPDAVSRVDAAHGRKRCLTLAALLAGFVERPPRSACELLPFVSA